MTSLSFFPPRDDEPREYPEWGTGKKFGEKECIWTPKGPTWQYDGTPTEQYYQLTQLKLSNVRTNDELLPSPQHTVMHNVLVKDTPFPAEHPYSSHIERTAMFPKFDSAADPKRGVRAMEDMPKNAEMPSQPYECTIVSKTKGSGLRREIQKLPHESQKKPLHWNEDSFDHVTKSPSGGKKSYYPWPPKTFKPNLTDRSDSNCIRGNMEISERTANAMRNVERDQWETTYDRTHTGLGPANPNDLDNMTEKRARDGDDDSLRPRSVRTFDPPRPAEGRIARALTPPPPPQTGRYPESGERSTRPLTLHEKEEKRLWHGGDYNNLPGYTGPGSKHENLEWLEQQNVRHPDSGLTNLDGAQGVRTELPYHPLVGAAPVSSESYIDVLAHQKHDEIQQMEANNRWQLLELQKPEHDRTALKHKMDLASDKTQPFVFYGHEGKFQRERSGLYKTTYDPYSLQQSMNKREMSGDGMFDITDCHQNALDNPLPINGDMHAIMRSNRTLGGPPGSVAQLHDQPSQFEMMGPFDKAKSLQKAELQPSLATADVRTQEGQLVLKESTMGDGYNTRKFLQENQLPFYSRNEPGILMSHENQDVNKVRLTAIPNAMAGAAGNSVPTEYVPAFGAPVSAGRPISAPENSTGVPTFSERYSYQWQVPSNELTQSAVNPRTTKLLSRHGVTNQYGSQSSNFMPADLSASWAPKSAYESQYKVDTRFKDDPRFQWKAGCGTPRPQTGLLGIQESFTRSDTRKKFHEQFSENLPDLRENITRGKKHEFGSMNAQVLRGTTLVEVA